MVARQHRFQLLIADDDRGVRETLAEMLQPSFETVEAECGEEAVEIIAHREIHLVLFDVHMPVLTGLEALRLVKRLRAELPCILMSADWTVHLREEALESRAAAVLDKPMTRKELVTTVTAALDAVYSDLWTPHDDSAA